jgi:hypothetical protein
VLFTIEKTVRTLHRPYKFHGNPVENLLKSNYSRIESLCDAKIFDWLKNIASSRAYLEDPSDLIGCLTHLTQIIFFRVVPVYILCQVLRAIVKNTWYPYRIKCTFKFYNGYSPITVSY